MKTTSEKPHFPTACALEYRLGFFQATRRPKWQKQTLATPWGIVKVEGRLGQQHADVFESICFEVEKKADMEDGRVKLLVDPWKVRARSRIGSGQQFGEICNELQTALLQIVEPVDKACSGHLIDHIDFAKKSDGKGITRHNPLTGGERNLWRVELGKAFCKLVERDIWVGHDPAMIAAMQHGISQAVTRHLVTHKTQPAGGWLLDSLIKTVAGGEISNTSIRHRRHELREDSSIIASAGFSIVGDRIQQSVQQKPGKT